MVPDMVAVLDMVEEQVLVVEPVLLLVLELGTVPGMVEVLV